MRITTRYMTENDCYKSGRTITPKGVMIHSTATPGVMAADWFSRWNKPNISKCVHAFVDDGGVFQYLPWKHRGWHAGGDANNTHIGIEICEPPGHSYSGSVMQGYDVPQQAAYFLAAYNNAVELAAFLCREYGLSERDVICHSEGCKLGTASNSADVMHWFPKHGKDMDAFRSAVAKILNEEESRMPGYMSTIPLGDIERIWLYKNTGKKTLPQVREEQGADYAMNAGFFNMSSFTPCSSGLTIAGEYLHRGYDPGYAMRGGDITPSRFNSEMWPDYIGGAPAIAMYGEAYQSNFTPEAHWTSKTARSAMGLSTDSLYLYCTQDGQTMDTLRKTMLDAGCSSAIALDGGGSSQCAFGGGDALKSTRIVYSILLVKLKKLPALRIGDKGETVKDLQVRLNRHGYGLTADGDFGAKTHDAVTALQAAHGLTADGIAGPKTYAALNVFTSAAPPTQPASRPTLRKGDKGDAVKTLQMLLNRHGYGLVADGDFGPKTDAAVRNFQKANGLTVDGICGAKTWARLEA